MTFFYHEKKTTKNDFSREARIFFFNPIANDVLQRKRKERLLRMTFRA